MSSPDPRTALSESRVSAAERRSILDTVWLMTLVLLSTSIGIGWFVGGMEIDPVPIAWLVFGYGALYVALSSTTERLPSPRWRQTSFWLLQTLGIVTLGVVWWLTGGLQNPLFLLFFALPVTASCLLAKRWSAYATAGVALLVVLIAALLQSGPLRWSLRRMGVPLLDLVDGLSARLPSSPTPFAGLNPPAGYAFITLLLFAVVMLSVAFISEALSAQLLQLYLRLGSSSAARRQAETLARLVLQSSPHPSVLVDSGTGEVVLASDSFVDQMLLDRRQLETQELTELIEFSFPDILRRAIAGNDVRNAVYRVGEEVRIADLTAYRIEHAGLAYTQLIIQDVTTSHYLRATLDSVDEAYIVIGLGGRIAYFNQAASDLFPRLESGELGAQALDHEADPSGWWSAGLSRSSRRDVRIGDQGCTAEVLAEPIAGERQRMTVLRVRRNR